MNDNATVICEMSRQEFNKLSKLNAANVADGTEIDLTWLARLIKFAKDNQATVVDLKTKCQELVTTINDLF